MGQRKYVIFLDDFIHAGGEVTPIHIVDMNRDFYRCIYRLEMSGDIAEAVVDLFPDGGRLVTCSKTLNGILENITVFRLDQVACVQVNS